MTFEIVALEDIGGDTLLDVREIGEFEAGCFDNAQHVALSKLSLTVDVMQGFDKTHTYILYCVKGMRARNAAQIMRDGGFENVCLLDRGYT
ncbi:MAG: rhodanese-like domain-containing protein [Alphaproteobacteria bacterium]|nr:rhodanese-like domain-containing protein [Alphaproteobacteria bacterium]